MTLNVKQHIMMNVKKKKEITKIIKKKKKKKGKYILCFIHLSIRIKKSY